MLIGDGNHPQGKGGQEMKRNSLWQGLTVIFVLLAIVALIGCSATEQTFTGTMEKTETGLFLKTSEGSNTFRVEYKPDLVALEGKSVKLTGSLMDREAGKTIRVVSFEVLE
ncbi:MAG: hypothetical protein PVF59_04190 [Desulfobacterales bacterium]|jgi:hypothetical protein